MISWIKRLGILEWRTIVPIVLGIMFGLGDGVANAEGRLYLTHISLYIRMALFICIFTMTFIAARRLLDVLVKRRTTTTITVVANDERHHFLDYSWSLRSLIKLGIIILLCWLPYIVMLFPGVYWSDTSQQLLEHYGTVPFTDHHPFASTYLFGWFADLGQILFGNPILGLYLVIVIQLITMPVLFAAIILYSKRMGIGRFVCHVELIFFALFPVFPVMFSSLAKDTVSAIFFVPFCLLFVEIVRSKGRVCYHAWVMPALVILGLFSCLMKKPCVYVIVPSLILICVLKLTNRARIIVAASGVLIATIMLIIIPKFVLTTLDIQEGGKQETIATIIQQVAHDVKYDPDGMTVEEKKIVSDFLVIPYDQISQSFDPVIADPIKGRSLKNPDLMGDFLKLWIRKTVEHPAGHLEAWLGLVQGWFSFVNTDGTPSYMVMCTESAWYYDPITELIPQWPKTAFASGIARDVYDAEQSVPVFNVLFYRALWASVFPFFLLYLAMRPGKGKFRRLVAMMPIDMSFAYLLLTPVSGMGGEPSRYILQLICVIPLFLCSVTREIES